mgnify:CR=1 FL=1
MYKIFIEKNTSTKALLDKVLKRLNISDEIIYNEYGKPYLKNSNLYFNLSDSKGVSACVISDKEVGIDIEKLRKTNLNVIDKFATPKEKEYILSNSNNIEKRLFEIYTLKEAYFKMLGTNLYNIKDVEFNINDSNITCSDKNIHCNVYYTIKGYIIAICKNNN